MSAAPSHNQLLIDKLASRVFLDGEDRAALAALDCVARTVEQGGYLGREGNQPTHCALIVKGFAFRHKLTMDGGRVIVSILLAGDFTDVQQLFLEEADHNVQTLTALECVNVSIAQLRELVNLRPNVSRAFWIESLIESSITREAVLNIARRDGPTRIAHILCEFQARLGAIGMAGRGYDLPMTQEQLGDACGLTAVHVNRTLRTLENEGLISRKRRTIHIEDWNGLRSRADFNSRYLHFDQAGVDERRRTRDVSRSRSSDRTFAAPNLD